MRTPIFLFTFLIIIASSSCQEKTCKVDTRSKEIFDKMISQLTEDPKKQGGSRGRSIRAVIYLEELTDIQSKALVGELSYFESEADLESDVKNWRNWYKENKCRLDKKTAESILEEVVESTPFLQLPSE